MRILGGAFRWGIFVGFLAVSALLTFLLWPQGALLFLVFPFLFPIRWRDTGSPGRADAKVCPSCGWSTFDPSTRYCPKDGTAVRSK